MFNSISRLGREIRPEQEWSDGTEFFGYTDFPEFKANLARHTQNFGMKFWKMSARLAPPPEISEFSVEWKASFVFFWLLLTN